MPRWTAEKFNESLTMLRDGMETQCEVTKLAIAAHKHLDRKGYVKGADWLELTNDRIDHIGEALESVLANQACCLELMNDLLAMPDEGE
mgnify:CR=1 FL=1